MQARVQRNDIGITLTLVKKNARARAVGTAILSKVEIKDGVCTGELVGEYPEVFPLSTAELPGPVVKRMKPLSNDVTTARIIYAAGREVFYLP